MERNSILNEKFNKLGISNKLLLRLITGLILLFITVVILFRYGAFRDGVYEVSTSFLIFYLLFSIAVIVYKELHFKTVSAGMMLMSLEYFLDAFEELSIFREDGLIDSFEDLSQDFMMLIAVVFIFLGFVIVLKRKDRKILSLKHTSLHDQLTGIYNRGALFQIYGHVEINEPVTFCYIDLDGFKEINDRNGHEAGDSILRDFAETITRHKRSNDQFFRIGGDEFILVIDTLELEVVGNMIERLRNIVREEISEYPIDFTCGFVPVTEPLTLDYVLRRADSLMYEKKRRKKN